MGNKANKHKGRHIYDELNKSIDEFTSCDDYSNNDDDNKRNNSKNKKRKSKDKNKLKYKIKKHNKIVYDNKINKKLIESSLLISDFLINNIINKEVGQRPMPDTNLTNSLLFFPDLFNNEGLDLENQKDYCDQLTYNGINHFIKQYKQFDMNKKTNNLSNEFYNNNPISTEKIFVNNNFNDLYKKNMTICNNNQTKSYDIIDNKTKNGDKTGNSFLYQPKQIKKNNKYNIKNENIIFTGNLDEYNNNRNIKKEEYFSNYHENQKYENRNKSYDNIDNDNPYIEKNEMKKLKINNIDINNKKIMNVNGRSPKKKKYLINKNNLFSPNEHTKKINTTINDLPNNNEYYSERNNNIKINNESYYNTNKNQNNNNYRNQKELSMDKIIKKRIITKKNCQIKKRVINYNDNSINNNSKFIVNNNKRNKSYDINNENYDKNNINNNIIPNINKKENVNYIERNNSFDILNDKARWGDNKIEKSSNFNIKTRNNNAICYN